MHVAVFLAPPHVPSAGNSRPQISFGSLLVPIGPLYSHDFCAVADAAIVLRAPLPATRSEPGDGPRRVWRWPGLVCADAGTAGDSIQKPNVPLFRRTDGSFRVVTDRVVGGNKMTESYHRGALS